MAQWIIPILQNLGFQVSNYPTLIYKDSQPTIGGIEANHLNIRVKHIYVPFNYVHKKYALLTIDPVNMKTTIQP